MSSTSEIPGGDSNVNLTLAAMKAVGKEEQLEMSEIQQDESEESLQDLEEVVNPFAQKAEGKQKEIKAHKGRIQKMLAGEKVETAILPIKQIKDTAEKFQGKNPELKSASLTSLRELIKPGDTKDDILKKLSEFYPDASLADEALDFLLETTDGELANEVKNAKDDLNAQKGREIAAGRNIGVQVREAAGKGLGTTTSLRDMYRDITGNPRDSPTLFEELSTKYAFKDLKKVIDFLLHSLGADMKSKGPSIPKGLLHRLFTETRSLQAILGVYRFFRVRMPLVEKLMTKEGIDIPAQLTFENMAKQFMTLAADRYPSALKVLQQAVKLGIEKWILAKIIAFSQFRDAVRQVAINQVYKSLQHRDELYLAILEALEDLEDQLEDLADQDDEDDDDDDQGGKNKGSSGKDTIESAGN